MFFFLNISERKKKCVGNCTWYLCSTCCILLISYENINAALFFLMKNHLWSLVIVWRMYCAVQYLQYIYIYNLNNTMKENDTKIYNASIFILLLSSLTFMPSDMLNWFSSNLLAFIHFMVLSSNAVINSDITYPKPSHNHFCFYSARCKCRIFAASWTYKCPRVLCEANVLQATNSEGDVLP